MDLKKRNIHQLWDVDSGGAEAMFKFIWLHQPANNLIGCRGKWLMKDGHWID